MKENKISIIINKPISEVFWFSINPANTNKWSDDIKKEETNEWPVKVGSKYRSTDGSGTWSEYTLVKFEENQIFELASEDGEYHVRYTYTSITENSTELEYFEWVDNTELSSPYSKNALEKLKELIESKSE